MRLECEHWQALFRAIVVGLLCLILTNPSSVFAAGANEYTGVLMEKGKGSFSFQGQAFLKPRRLAGFSPDISAGLGKGLELIAVAEQRIVQADDAVTFPPAELILRYQIRDGMALGLGPRIPIESGLGETEIVTGFYATKNLPGDFVWTTNIIVMHRPDELDNPGGFVVGTVEHFLRKDRSVFVEVDATNLWPISGDINVNVYVGAELTFDHGHALNLFVTTPSFPSFSVKEGGVGFVYTLDWSL